MEDKNLNASGFGPNNMLAPQPHSFPAPDGSLAETLPFFEAEERESKEEEWKRTPAVGQTKAKGAGEQRDGRAARQRSGGGGGGRGLGAESRRDGQSNCAKEAGGGRGGREGGG